MHSEINDHDWKNWLFPLESYPEFPLLTIHGWFSDIKGYQWAVDLLIDCRLYWDNWPASESWLSSDFLWLSVASGLFLDSSRRGGLLLWAGFNGLLSMGSLRSIKIPQAKKKKRFIEYQKRFIQSVHSFFIFFNYIH